MDMKYPATLSKAVEDILYCLPVYYGDHIFKIVCHKLGNLFDYVVEYHSNASSEFCLQN